MAIKIPVRSSASESVGGKTIRVPHGGQGAVALPRGSKNPVNSVICRTKIC